MTGRGPKPPPLLGFVPCVGCSGTAECDAFGCAMNVSRKRADMARGRQPREDTTP